MSKPSRSVLRRYLVQAPARVMEYIAELEAENERLQRTADENYMELADDMDESWGYSPGRTLRVDWPELHAKINSRIVHRPAQTLRQQRDQLREDARALAEALSALRANPLAKFDADALLSRPSIKALLDGSGRPSRPSDPQGSKPGSTEP